MADSREPGPLAPPALSQVPTESVSANQCSGTDPGSSVRLPMTTPPARPSVVWEPHHKPSAPGVGRGDDD